MSDIVQRWQALQKPPVRLQHEAALAVPDGWREISLGELVTDFEILDANGDYIVVAPPSQEVERYAAKQLAHTDTYFYPELGSTGQSKWNPFMREEYNPELREHMGLQKYDRMRRNDASVRSALRLFKTPILAARWYVQPFTPSRRDQEIAEFIHRCLFHYMSISWSQVLLEALLMLDYGYYMFEKVYAEREGQLIWQKLAPRHPLDVTQWKHDRNGGVDGVMMYGPDFDQDVYIPIEKLAVFSFDREGGDLRGMSALRSAYKHWYFKENLYKIDAIQKERHGVGVPIIKLPPGFTDGDRTVAHELGRNLRSNEKAHVVLPPFWEVMFAKLEGQAVDSLASAEHHSKMIFQNILGEFMTASGTTNEGQMEMFLKSTRYIADTIRDVFNSYCIPYLVHANFADVEHGECPELKVRRIGDTQDWRMISFALRNLIGAQVIQPDDKLDVWIRDEMDLPRADPDTARQPPAPQNPGSGQPGAPRQSQAGNMRNQPGQGGNDQNGQSGTGTQ